MSHAPFSKRSARSLRASLRALAVFLPMAAMLAASGAPAAAQPGARVYLFNGILGLFFSTGMKEIADELQAQGIEAGTYAPSEWRQVADRAADDYRQGRIQTIVLVGYSAGVQSVNSAVARLTAAGVPVRLAVGLDPLKPSVVSGHVASYVNFYEQKDRALPVVRGEGFQGNIENVHLDDIPGIDHTNVDDNTAVQQRILGTIRSAL